MSQYQFLHAKELREKQENREKEEQLAIVFKSIERASLSNTCFQCTISSIQLSPKTKYYLQELGYAIKEFHENSIYRSTQISW